MQNFGWTNKEITVFIFFWELNDVPMRNWKQCLCKILGGQTKSIMVYLILANRHLKINFMCSQTSTGQTILILSSSPHTVIAAKF